MQQRKTTTQGSSDIDVREAYDASPETAVTMGKPLVTAILLASGTLCISGIAATLLPAFAADDARFGEAQPVANVLRAPAHANQPAPVAEPVLPRALERLAVSAAQAVAKMEQRLDQQKPMPEPVAPIGFASPAPVRAASTTGSTVVAPASDSARVVYLVDASGSLLDSLPQVIDWLGESLDSLGNQSFTVLFFREGQVFEAPPRGMKPGSFAAKASVWTWIQPDKGNVIPQGRSDLLGAVEVAMGYEPDELYVVSDDSFNRSPTDHRSDDGAILDGISARLGRTPPRVHTVQFFYRDEAGALEAIADRFRGSYTFIEPAERNTTAAGDPLLELSIVN